jgi:hypothetical protein
MATNKLRKKKPRKEKTLWQKIDALKKKDAPFFPKADKPSGLIAKKRKRK